VCVAAQPAASTAVHRSRRPSRTVGFLARLDLPRFSAVRRGFSCFLGSRWRSCTRPAPKLCQAVGGVPDGTASRGERGPRATLRALGPTPARGTATTRGETARATHTSRRDATHCHVPVCQGTRLKLGRPIGRVQVGWRTSSGRLAAEDSGWFGCETADVVAERWVRPAGSTTAGTVGRSKGTCGPAALNLGRQATGGATSAPRAFQHEPAPGCGLQGSVLRATGCAQKRRGATVRATTGAGASGRTRCHVPVRQGTRLRLGRPIGGVQVGWRTSSGRLVAEDSGWFGCETADVAGEPHRGRRAAMVPARARAELRPCRHSVGRSLVVPLPRPESFCTV
jgi:hypothetical protein